MKCYWESNGNTLGTTKNEKFPFHPTLKIEVKKIKPFEAFNGCMKFLFPK
jgi:hypothetical protein